MSNHRAQSRPSCRREIWHHTLAWIGLCFALTIHLVDEVAGIFLSVYDPDTRVWCDRLPFLQQPNFTFEVWLTGIVMIIIILFSLTFFAFLGLSWMRVLSFPVAILMVVNGLGHLAGTLTRGQAIPGIYSVPLLLAAAFYLLLCTHKLEQKF